MTGDLLGTSYYKKAVIRLKALDLFFDEEDYSDVVREAQEIVELVLKGVLRKRGIEPPKLHDVGPLLIEHADKLPVDRTPHLKKIAVISKWLRKEREFSFYGDVDLIPTEEYSEEDAVRARSDASFVVEWAVPLFR
jgi:HEPN domain-containing protein